MEKELIDAEISLIEGLIRVDRALRNADIVLASEVADLYKSTSRHAHQLGIDTSAYEKVFSNLYNGGIK